MKAAARAGAGLAPQGWRRSSVRRTNAALQREPAAHLCGHFGGHARGCGHALLVSDAVQGIHNLGRRLGGAPHHLPGRRESGAVSSGMGERRGTHGGIGRAGRLLVQRLRGGCV